MLPKQSEIELPLLKCLDELGGRARPRDIHHRIAKFFPHLTTTDLAVTLPSGANKWKNSIAWVRQKLISNGQMSNPEPGMWAITERGRTRLAEPEHAPSLRKRRAGAAQHATPTSIERLCTWNSRSVRSEVRSRLRDTENPEIAFENSVWTVVHSLLPSAITVGRDPEIHLPSQIFRPDSVAFFEDSVALVVECKLTTSDEFVAGWISEFRNIKRELEEVLRAAGRKQFAFVLAVKDKTALKNHVKRSADQLRIKLIDQREIHYFSSLHKSLGIGVSHLFWGRVAPWMIRHKEEKLPALHLKRAKGRDVYIFSANAHDLLSRCFVSHRELHGLEEGEVGFQRMLQRKKLTEIKKYIERFHSFPTPIIVAFRKPGAALFEPLPLKERAVESMRADIEVGCIKLPKEPQSIQIIDGQHRLYGYSGLAHSDNHIVHVVAYKAPDAQSLATMFVDINSKQTRVPSSLLWELYPDIYGDEDPEYYRAVISRAAEAVVKNQLAGLAGHISSGMKGEISFQTLCAEIKRARLLDKTGGLLQSESELRAVLDAFVIALKELEKRFPGVNSAFVFSNNGITPFIRTMGRILQYEISHNRKANLRTKNLMVETFCTFYEPVYKYYSGLGEAKLRALRKRIGNAGFNTTDDEVTDQIRLYKPDFPYRPKRVLPEWQSAVDKFASLAVNINRQVESGKISNWVFREFDSEKFKKHLAKAIDSRDSFGSVLTTLYKDIIEGSGKEGIDNRLAHLLNVPKIYDIDAVSKLNVLRTYWEHKTEQVDAKKRQLAVQAMAELSGRQNLVGPSELDQEDYQAMAIALVKRLTEQVLEPALAALQ